MFLSEFKYLGTIKFWYCFIIFCLTKLLQLGFELKIDKKHRVFYKIFCHRRATSSIELEMKTLKWTVTVLKK